LASFVCGTKVGCTCCCEEIWREKENCELGWTVGWLWKLFESCERKMAACWTGERAPPAELELEELLKLLVPPTKVGPPPAELLTSSLKAARLVCGWIAC